MPSISKACMYLQHHELAQGVLLDTVMWVVAFPWRIFWQFSYHQYKDSTHSKAERLIWDGLKMIIFATFK